MKRVLFRGLTASKSGSRRFPARGCAFPSRQMGMSSSLIVPVSRELNHCNSECSLGSSLYASRCFSSFVVQDDDTADSSTHTIPFLLADIGEGIHEVELLQWYVQPGDVLQQFDLVAQVQSDKATVDISSRFDGVVTELGGQVGDMVQVGTPLLYLKVNGENGAPEDQQLQQEAGKDKDIPPVTSSIGVSDKQTSIDVASKPTVETSEEAGDDIASSSLPPPRASQKFQASPAVRRLCDEYGITDPSVQIPATGPNGRILKADVLAFLESQGIQTSSVMPTSSKQDEKEIVANVQETRADGDEKDTILPLKGYTRVMAQTMTESLQIPHMTLGEEVDVTELLQLRAKLASEHKISLLAFVIKACSLALAEYPKVNASSHSATEIQLQSSHHIGVAMDTPRGLVVPAICNVQDLSLLEIQAALDDLKDNVLSLNLQDMPSPTFTLSNIGALGAGLSLQPVLVAPQLAMGAMGRLQRLPRFVGNDDSTQIREAHILPVSWAADHRYLDGATLARFHVAVQQYLQDPLQMLIHLK